MAVVNGFKNGHRILKYNYNALENIPDNYNEVVPITYSDLKMLRDGRELKSGTLYRITDFVTIINGTYDLSSIVGQTAYIHYARSANHPFDLIVLAINECTLSEDAIAVQHNGDLYFDTSDLEKWEVKYTIDNDASVYAWADETNGKGVITYLKDEFGNEAYYDFKNIQFLAYGLKRNDDTLDDICMEGTGLRFGNTLTLVMVLFDTLIGGSYITYSNDYDFRCGSDIVNVITYPSVNDEYLENFYADWYYTFNYRKSTGSGYISLDYSLNNDNSGEIYCYDNVIKNSIDFYGKISDGYLTSDSFYYLSSNIFENIEETDNVVTCGKNYFDANSYFNIFGSNCYENKAGYFLNRTILANGCHNNTIGSDCNRIILHSSNCFNSFGDNITKSVLSIDCHNNSFGNNSGETTMGVNCGFNIIGNQSYGMVFGNQCSFNRVGDNSYGNNFGSSCAYNTLLYSDSNSFPNNSWSNVFIKSSSNNYSGLNIDEMSNNIFYCSNFNGYNCTMRGNRICFSDLNSFNTNSTTYSKINYCLSNLFNGVAYSEFNKDSYNEFINILDCTFDESIVNSNFVKIQYSYFGKNIRYFNISYNGSSGMGDFYHVCDNLHGSQGSPIIISATADNGKEIWIGKNSQGNIVQWCPADLASIASANGVSF